jgi:ribosome maturation factor RimP
VLRLFVDRDGGVTLDACAELSRLCGDVIAGDGLDKAIDHYTLEVSSPGLDRPLVRPKDFRRFVGHDTKLTLKTPVDGRRRFAGELLAADEEKICLDVDGKERVFTYPEIERARLVPVIA